MNSYKLDKYEDIIEGKPIIKYVATLSDGKQYQVAFEDLKSKSNKAIKTINETIKYIFDSKEGEILCRRTGHPEEDLIQTKKNRICKRCKVLL